MKAIVPESNRTIYGTIQIIPNESNFHTFKIQARVAKRYGGNQEMGIGKRGMRRTVKT